MEGFSMENAIPWLISQLPNIIGALATLIIGFWIAGIVTRAVKKMMMRNGMDETVTPFIGSLVNVAMKVMVLIAAAGWFGIETTSFVAILGAMTFAVGMALQGSLSHFASGVMMLVFKPYKVGDLIEIAGGSTGTVEELGVFNTVLRTLDNKKIIVPNGNVTGNTITNISGQGEVGVELTYGIGYDDDIDAARAAILRVGKSCPYILDEPAQGVVVAELADASVNLATRPFVKSEHYWDAYFYMQEHVKKEFDKENIGIPYPTMDVHVKSGSANA